MSKLFEAETVNEAFEQVFEALSAQATTGTSTSRDGNVVGEILNAMIVVKDPTRNIIKSPIRKMPMRYAVGELLYYLSGSNLLDSITPFSEVWNRLSDDGETVNSAYGYRIFKKFGFDQWEHVKNLLIKDQNSRQAVIHIKDADNTPTKDMPCTVSLQFFLREGKLHLTVYMRSNDIWMGFPYDAFSFTCLQMLMAMQLGVAVGEYTHIAGSLHLYERDYNTAKNNMTAGV